MFCNSCVWAYLLWEFNFLGVPRHSCLPVKHFHVNPQVRGSQGFPSGASGKEPACQCRRCKRLGFALGLEDPLEEGIATHSSILAWRILWTEEPGRLGWRSVRHNWSNFAHTHTHTHMVPNQTPLTHGLMTWLFTPWWKLTCMLMISIQASGAEGFGSFLQAAMSLFGALNT